MSPSSPSYTIIKYNGSEGRFIPKIGEIIALRFSQDLFGPGSELGIHHDLPSRVTRYNYHHAVVLRIVMDDHVSFTILPMPTPLPIQGLVCHQPAGCLPNPTIFSDFISLFRLRRIPHDHIPRSRHQQDLDHLFK